MHCILVSQEQLDAARVELGADAAHHLRDVLRARVGDEVELLDGRGRKRRCVVADASRHAVSLAPAAGDAGAVRTLPRPAACVTLYVCIAKREHMEWLLEKATELGADRIVPVISSRVVARPDVGEIPPRWARIVESAICQSNAAWATQLAPCVMWRDAVAAMRESAAPVFVGSLAPGAKPLAALARTALAAAPAPRECALVIGPEGDFSPEELAELLALPNALPATFGDRVLRVETAAVYGISVILAEAAAL